jgi:hypothetical protein
VAQQVGGKGGGKPDLAMAGGTDAAALPAALASVAGWVADPLGASRSAVSTAYEIAKAGGDGAKLLKQLPKLGRKQLEKSMDSLEQRALEHEEKIRHPAGVIPAWEQCSPEYQTGLVAK